MELAAFVVQAVLVEGRSVREVARAYGVSKTWLYELWPATGPRATPAFTPAPNGRIVHRPVSPKRSRTRSSRSESSSTDFGVEAGPDTIHTHLTRTHDGVAPCSVSSVWRILTRRGFITPEPHKRPKSSYVRFEAALPNECWQMDVTHVALKNGRVADVLNSSTTTAASASPAAPLWSLPPPTSSRTFYGTIASTSTMVGPCVANNSGVPRRVERPR